jgi:hypothetical protein
MHFRSLSAAAGFAAGLLVIYFVPTGGWSLYGVLVLAVSLLAATQSVNGGQSESH